MLTTRQAIGLINLLQGKRYMYAWYRASGLPQNKIFYFMQWIHLLLPN